MACYSNAELSEIEAVVYRARIATNENQLKFQGCLIISLRAEIAKLREWIVMADNRLECKDCPQCVDIARSYLQEALNPNEQKGESGS